ncbi:MAG: hypothetical protein Rubg2KO_41160 [Rubricoccaceae bacterium]
MRTSSLSAFGLAFLIAASFISPEALAQGPPASQNSQNASCSNYGAGDFEIGLNITSLEYDKIRVKVFNVATGALVSNKVADKAVQISGAPGCNWVAHVGEAIPLGTTGRIRLDSNVLYRIDFSNLAQTDGWSYYYLLEKNTSQAGTSIFTPRGLTGAFPDLLFLIGLDMRVYPTELGGGASGRDVDDFFTGSWVLPYDLPTICASTGCSAENDNNYMFLTPTTYTTSAPAGLPITLTSTGTHDWIVPASRDYTWSSSQVNEIRFKDGLTVKGDLDVDGIILKPTGSTWAGITVSNGTLTLDGAEVRNASGNGIYATGSSADVTITGESKVENSGSIGVYANSGADVIIDDESKIIDSGSYGVRSRGSGTYVRIQDAFVQSSGSYATISDYYGDIDLRNTPSAAKLNSNVAGVSGETAGQIDTGTAGGNRIVQTTSSATDVFGMDGAYMDVRRTYWGVGITSSSQLDIFDGDADIILVNPLLTTDPSGGTGSVQASVPTVSLASADGLAETRRSDTPQIPYSTQVGLGTTQGWVEVAEGSGADDAVNAIQLALGAAKTDAERQMAWSAAARLAIRIQTRLKDAASSTRLDALATAGLSSPADAAWARRVLALSGASRGPEARSATRQHLAALTALPVNERSRKPSSTEASPLSHAAFGHLLTIQVALDDADASGALEALTALAALDPYQAEQAASHLTTVLPQADVQDILARAGEHARLAQAAISREGVSVSTFGVAPNPSAGRVTLRFKILETSEVELSVYDALGRLVASLVNGSVDEGTHEAPADLSALPAGVYVARLSVRGSDSTVESVRFTVTR